MDSKLMLYGRFVGRWEAEARAFQDVWITPPREGPNVGKSERWGPLDNQYGTTIRVYDPKLDAFRVTWIDPCAGYRAELIGCAQDGGIFQEGTGSDGTRLRWIFSDLARDSFRWRAELSRDGQAWFKALELFAQREK